MHAKAIATEDGENQMALETRIQKRREASAASSVEAHNMWRQKCQRVGSKWVPKVPCPDEYFISKYTISYYYSTN